MLFELDTERIGDMRITESDITELKTNEIFVFGSNESGRHGKGAAKMALKWGAKYGQPSGLQGKTYGIPTMNSSISKKLKIEKVKYYVNKFFEFAKEHEELKFLVTAVGCGLAGFTDKEIAPLFKECALLKNIWLPKKFWRIINKEK